MNRKERQERQKAIKELIEEHGYEKSVRELCKAGYCCSRAEARRVIRYEKIMAGEKKLRHK